MKGGSVYFFWCISWGTTLLLYLWIRDSDTPMNHKVDLVPSCISPWTYSISLSYSILPTPIYHLKLPYTSILTNLISWQYPFLLRTSKIRYLIEREEFQYIRPRNSKMLQMGSTKPWTFVMLAWFKLWLLWDLAVHPKMWLPLRALDGTGAGFVPSCNNTELGGRFRATLAMTWVMKQPKSPSVISYNDSH